MRIIEGYVCIAVFDGGFGLREILFGKDMQDANRTYSNIAINDLTPFENISEAQIAKKELEERDDMKNVSMGSLKMKLAETEEEVFSLEDEKNLIVVVRFIEGGLVDFELIGPCTEGASNRYPRMGSLLEESDWKPFPRYTEELFWVLKEEARQTKAWTSIATFSLQREV